MNINPIFLKDFYKVGHIDQYPKGTELIFSNFTPRKSKMPGVNHSVFFGLKYFINTYLHKFDSCLSSMRGPNCEMYEDVYKAFMDLTLGNNKQYSHIRKLLNLDKLPLKIYALPEGSIVPCGIPALVIFNTHPDFFWLPGMLETILSCTLWGTCTSATIAREYRLILDRYAAETSDIPEFVDYQGHDFSMRGMFGLEAAILSGLGHLQYFKGTDTIPAMIANSEIYGKSLEICSVPATEHSVMSAGGKENEFETYRRLICDAYPSGILSIVSDTWDLWKVVSDYLPRLRNEIMSRDGKVVIRPDSGDPVEILCGKITESYPMTNQEILESKGLIECLWDIFGGTINSKRYKQLDSHIGAIYGDSITLDRCNSICERLKQKGFSSTNVVFGIGSFTYQHVTRDTLGWAMKATYAEINGVGRAITKDPITDDGTKKSHSGLLKVIKVEGAHGSTFEVKQDCTWEEFYDDNNELKLVYEG